MTEPTLQFGLLSDGSEGFYYGFAKAKNIEIRSIGITPFDTYTACLSPLIAVTDGVLKHEIQKIVLGIQGGCLSKHNRDIVDEKLLKQSYEGLKGELNDNSSVANC